MKLEVRTVSLTIDPGFVVEGDSEEQIKEAVAKMFDYGMLSSVHVWVDGIGCVKTADAAPSVHAQDIEDDEDGAGGVIDRVIADVEEFRQRHGDLFEGSEAA